MKPTLADNILVVLYFLLWVVTFILYHRKFRNLDGGSVIIGSYFCYAFFSILTLNNPITLWDYYDYHHLTVFPFIYLFVMLIIALSPAIRYHNNPASQIEAPSSLILYVLSAIIILSALVLFPNVIANLGDGLIKLLTDTDAGKDAYEEQLKNAADSGSGIGNIPAIIFNALSEIAIFLFFYFLTLKRKNVWLVAGLGFAIMVAVLQPIMAGQRSLVIYTVLTVILGFFFFKQFFSDVLRKVMRYIGIIGIGLTMIPVIAITVSRFSQYRQSTVTDYVNWYIGQGNIYFNNYALDDNGIRYGDRTLNLVKRVISSNASDNFVERRDTFSNLYVNDDIFTTFVGDFAIDYGPVLAFLIFVVFNAWVLFRTRVQDGKIKIQQAILLYFTMCVCMQGGMTLFTFADTANLKMFCMFALYFYLVFYDTILEKFPQHIEYVRHADKPLPKKRIIVK
ncbi:MAG: oligosaccharide repeat unit polymerase [Bacteroidaceae bacterium]|nr:oligosaccharide repeat unit polymerase [Bacteroidaceae bacterium]